MSRLSPEDADRLFSSAAGAGDPDPLAEFVRDVRATFATEASADAKASHLRAMAEQFADSKAPRATITPRRMPLGRAALAAVAGSVLVAGTALAATGHLPSPAQTAVAHAVRFVGLDIPQRTPSPHRVTGVSRAGGTNRDAADAFTDAKKAWTDCVAEKARQHKGPGPFNPEAPLPAGCGPKPAAHDFHSTEQTKPDSGGHGPNEDNGKSGTSQGNSDQGDHGQPAVTATAPPSATPNDGEHGSGGHNDHGHGQNGSGGQSDH